MKKESAQLGLIPLHSSCPSKAKLDAKIFPLVLGRTNLASWWWESCPCEKYCRLHCKPVAQNIRSLSKVMIMIDSFGRLNVVGKNPHLITITPERSDYMLQENDVISIGRRDREPWMRLRVVKKTNDSRFLSRGRTKKPTNAWPASERNMDIVSFTRVKSPNSPPEWITTTCKRNAASMDGNCSEQRSNVAANTNGAEDNNMYPDVPLKLDGDLYRRKRRRASRDDSHGLKTSQVIKVGTKEKHHLVETKAGKHEKKRLVGGSKSENRIHFVVQDYARSAMFVEATQRRRGKTNIRNVAGTVSSQRRLFEDNTQSNCSSPSVAAGLMEAVSPACEPNTYLKQKDNSSLDIGRAAIRSNWNAKLDRNGVLNKHDCGAATGAARLSVESRMPGDSLSVDENDEPVQKSGAFAHYQRPFQDKIDYMVQPSVVGKKENVENILPPKPKSISEPIEGGNLEEIDNRNAGVGQSASILSLPHCASFSGETQNREFSLIGNNTDKTTQMPNEFNSSPTQRDHHETLLGVWRAVMEQEKKGNQSSFRYALASLIVAKNEKNASEDVWLPDLLEDKFSK